MLKHLFLFIALLSISFSMGKTETHAQAADLSYELQWQFGKGQAMQLDWGDLTPGISIRTTHGLQVLDPTTLEVLWNKDSPTTVGQVDWHDNGRFIASTSERHLEIFDYETNEETIIENQASLWTLTWHPVDLKIAGSSSDFVSGEEVVMIWDVTTGEQNVIAYDFARRVDTLAWSPDGERLAIGSRSGEVVIYDINSGASIDLWNVSDEAIQSLAWHPEGIMLAVASSYDAALTLWDTDTLEQINSIDVPDLFSQISWDTNGRYLAGQSSKGISIWDITTNDLAVLEHESQPILDFAWRNLSLALLFQDGTIEVWDTMTQERRISKSKYIGLVSSFDVNTEHNLITVMFQGTTTIQILDARNGELRQSIEPNSPIAPSDLLSVSWNALGDRLAVAFHEAIEIWKFDEQTGEVVYVNTITYEGRITDVEWHPILISMLSVAWGDAEQRSLLLIDTSANIVQNEISVDGLIEVVWHPDGREVAIYQSIQPDIDDDPLSPTRLIQILNADSFEVIQTLIFEDMSPLSNMLWIPGTTDLFGIQCRVSIEGCAYWTWNSVTQTIETVDHESSIRTNTFDLSSDGNYIVIGDMETGVQILNLSLDVEFITIDFVQQPETISWERERLYISDGRLSAYVIN